MDRIAVSAVVAPMNRLAGVCLFGLLAVPASAAAQTGRVTFDDLSPDLSFSGEPLVLPNADDRGLRITFEGPALRVINLVTFSGNPVPAGNALITWQWPQQDGIVVRFSRPMQQVGISAGDYAGDADGPLVLRAFDCQGVEVDRASAPWGDGQMPPFARLEVEAPQICHVVYTSGGPFAGSAFLDDLTFTEAARP